ncbi:Type I Iterative PKS [Diaporthe australafricana]|uniref:Type I Iterative PKS n=1 Tax=Diaporthe australafricana TaxID=127596 RepID=A0ABR3WKE1_9PEZI
MEWFDAFKRVRTEFIRDTIIPDGHIVVFGFERPIPPSMAQCLASQVNYDYMAVTSERNEGKKSAQPKASEMHISDRLPTEIPGYSRNDIAIVGMSIKVAGANDLESFWDVLCSGKSQHKEVPKERFTFGNTVFRDAADPLRKWFANLIDDPAEFDHHFFKKSPRESAAMDPQQRHMLQIAYQAVEMSGYFRPRAPSSSSTTATTDEKRRRVGCFIGCSTCDYEHNTACHNTSAFSATGQLRAFVAGKVSHFFGWTGPSVTIDTACSSSAVAVHQACQAILAGDCGAALAGGSFVMAGPQWFEDLSAASFLSPTGQCKPFDAAADGYCRGDGVAAVFLKRLGDALADGDEVLGVIGATTVQQNENCTSIFVPNEPSLSNLFGTVLGKAGLQPGDISVVEAHGTGTAVGDPAEYGAIRHVLGGPNRSKVTGCNAGEEKKKKPLYLGSVKGSVGHTECTAGVVSLIKVALMLNKGMIPPQASFSRINMSMNPRPDDNIVINTGSVKSWDAEFKAALVSSYGASGSNACILLKQAPKNALKTTVDAFPAGLSGLERCQHPFWLSAKEENGLRRYVRALRKFISDGDSYKHGRGRLPMMKLSISLSQQKSRLLDQSLMFKANSLEDLENKLRDYENGASPDLIPISRPSSKPVIFCFGGQVSTSIGLDRGVFEGAAILQNHLKEVDAIARSHITGGILPTVLDKSTQHDPVKLQVALFALQYASARSWMDSGVKPVAVVGHSFGEISAMCVSGVLSLRDAVALVVSRATLVRDAWGADKGAMIAIEADLSDAQELVADSDGKVAIACYNGPRSFTLGGSTAAIVEIEKTIAAAARPIKSKRLDVSNAFHCPLVDPLVPRLDKCAQNIKFSKPEIHIERSTEFFPLRDHLLGPQFVSRHMREPVYFHHAMQRLGATYQQSGAIFLEAGSNSTITNMASRAMGDMSSRFNFQAVNITAPYAYTAENSSTGATRCWNSLVDATVNLWAAGDVDLQHWAHHRSQPRPDGAPLLLPPYQFEPARHWLDRIPITQKLQVLNTSATEAISQENDYMVSANGMVSFGALVSSGEIAGPGDDEPHGAGNDNVLFRVVTQSLQYAKLVKGHRMAHTAGICPAPVQVDLVIEALCMTLPGRPRSSRQQSSLEGSSALLSASHLQPQISDFVCYVPLSYNPARMVWIEIPPVSHACELLQFAHSSVQHGHEHGNDDSRGSKGSFDRDFPFELFSTDLVDERDWESLSRQSSFGNKTKHTTGTVKLVHCNNTSTAREFAQLSRLVNHTQVTQLLQDVGADNVLSHKGVYFMFESIVEYCDEYRGIQRLVSRKDQTAAIVRRPHGHEQISSRQPREEDDELDGRPDYSSWFQPCVADTFAQTAGMWMNCLAADVEPEQLFVFNGFERWLRAPLKQNTTGDEGDNERCERPAELHVLATQHRTSDKTAVSDVFVFDAVTGKLFEGILGMGWVKVPRSHMQETLARLAGSSAGPDHRTVGQDPTVAAVATAENTPLRPSRAPSDEQRVDTPTSRTLAPAITVRSLDVHFKIKQLLAELSGLSINHVGDNSELASLGIDSLMNMELASEIRSTFKIETSESELIQITYVSGLVEYVEKLVGSSTTTTTTNTTTSETQTLFQDESADDQSSSSNSSWGSLAISRNGSSHSEYGTISPMSPSLASRDDEKEPWLKGVLQSPEQLAARKAAVDGYVRTLTQDWADPLENSNIPKTFEAPSAGHRAVVVVTGGTGGLGAHLVARLATDPGVARVVCLNRPNARHPDPLARQMDAVLSKAGLDLSRPQHADAATKLRVFETDLSQPNLGLCADEHAELVAGVTHVVHNAWTMSLAHGLDRFEPQLRIMRRLLDLVRDAALLPLAGGNRSARRAITFQFVSSIGVVGHYPLRKGGPVVPEERVDIDSVLPAGYADAKWACELMLDETLHRWPGLFRPMAVRLGQVAASRSGYWNTAEHVSFIIRSSQTLSVLPDFCGTLGWTPVDDIVSSLADLLFVGNGDKSGIVGCQARPYPIYNIDSPMRTPWREMTAVLAGALGLDLGEAVIPFEEWVQRVRGYGSQTGDGAGGTRNPAYLLIDFLEANFGRISCGGLLLETSHAQEHSPTMRNIKPFSHNMTRLFIQKWKESGFLD